MKMNLKQNTMKTVNTDTNAYYTQRAPTYEEMYAKPERQSELTILHERVSEILEGHRVLELGCGTGYWTERIMESAESVHAIDTNFRMIEIAKTKKLPAEHVQFSLEDAYSAELDGDFSACFGGFWWSHVKREEQARHLENLRARIGKGGVLVMIDTTFVEGVDTPIARTDLEGNTHQIERLPTGDRYEILKNFPTDSALRKKISVSVTDLRVLRLEYYWMVSGKFK
jgi:SAM-dependent methyltransferase